MSSNNQPNALNKPTVSSCQQNNFIASFSPVKDVYKSVSTSSNYSSSSSLVSTASSARPQSQQSQQSSGQHGPQHPQQQQLVNSQATKGENGVPVQRSASFNAATTVPLSISKPTHVKNSASFSNCSLLSKVAKKSGLTGSLTSSSLLKFSSSNSANSLLQLKQQQQANGITISSNISDALAMAGQNPNPCLSGASSGQLRNSPSASASSNSLASSTTSTVTAAAAAAAAGSTAATSPGSTSSISAALSIAQFSKNNIVDYYV